MWAQFSVVANNVSTEDVLFAINVGKDYVIIASKGVFDCERLHL